MTKLAGVVAVTDPEGAPRFLGPDDELPQWAVDQITNPKAWAEEPASPEPAAEPVPEVAAEPVAEPVTDAVPAEIVEGPDGVPVVEPVAEPVVESAPKPRARTAKK